MGGVRGAGRGHRGVARFQDQFGRRHLQRTEPGLLIESVNGTSASSPGGQLMLHKGGQPIVPPTVKLRGGGWRPYFLDAAGRSIDGTP